MPEWLQGVVLVVLVGSVLPLVIAACSGELGRWRSIRWVLAHVLRVARLRRREGEGEVVALRRPIEQVGADLRRLHASFHRDGLRFVKYEGCRLAYDQVLAEAADMAGAPHLLGLLEPGPELDRERLRVEHLLRVHGMLPPHAA